jgi:small-conductance mechanosensitive channel
MIERLARDTAVACAALCVVALAVWPSDWRVAGGVAGGGLLIGGSFWAISGAVTALATGRKRRGLGFVKYFTRYGILALAAYGMMVRLHLSPLGLLTGVSALGVAVGVEAIRDLRGRRLL